MQRHRLLRSVTGLTLAASTASFAQTMKAPDIRKDPTLYVVPYAHLDTQWRWEMPQSISEYLLKTMRVNFDYMEKYPHYVFNWTGANRYRLMKEYFPDDYARMSKYIAAGRWYPAGSSMEEGDVNLPSAEGIFRQVLYGNTYFRHEFGKASEEYMLPDCFGFPASLPAILAHSGVKGFSTQKLNADWQPAPRVGGPDSPEHTPEGIPFNVGVWIGPDGSKVLAAVNPGSYNSNAYVDLSKVNEKPRTPPFSQAQIDALTPSQQRALHRYYTLPEPNWVDRIALDGKVTGVFADYHYIGTGDIGGATQEATVKLLEAIATKSETVLPQPNFMPQTASAAPVRVGEGPVHVVISTADQMFKDIQPDMAGRMPSYQGDLELINHSAGSLTSQAYHKRWVTENEMLADAAEKSSLLVAWMGGTAYPQKRLNDAWTVALGGHFHDTAAGTATPRAYEFAWNDDVLVANQFGGVFTNATQEIASALDTRGEGTPVVLFNALNVPREDVVTVALPHAGKGVRVMSPEGKEVPAQLEGGKAVFAATVPPVGYAVYHVVPGGAAVKSALRVTESSLENQRYVVKLNGDGDIASIFDKQLNKELLASPLRLALSNDTPKQWPAWNMDFDQEQAAPTAFVGGPAKVTVVERGPARVALEVDRAFEGSTYKQTIRLAAGDAGNRVEIANVIDWRGKAENLKATFALTASNPNATYNEDVGVVQRPNAFDRQFEVMSHRWIDLTDKSGAFGVTVLTEAKNASDKPNDNTIRLTLLRTPGISQGGRGYSDQANQDWGHHEFTFAIAGHAGDWRMAQTDWQGYRLADPVRAFVTTAHPGSLGRELSFVKVNNARIRVLALKKAEDSDEIILRAVELDGKPANDVQFAFAAPVAAAREVTAQEQELGAATVQNGSLVSSFKGYEPKTFALRLAPAKEHVAGLNSQPVALTYDLAAATNDDAKTPNGGFDGEGNAYPAEMLASDLTYNGVAFKLAHAATGTPDAVVAKGQTIALPAGRFNRVYVLAAAKGDQSVVFTVGKQPQSVTVENWGGFIGQWDTRLWKETPRDWAISAHPGAWPPADLAQRESWAPALKFPDDYVGLREGYIKPANVAWYASHHHTAAGLNEPYQYSYLFAYALDVPAGATTLTLPNNPNVRVFAVSAAEEAPAVTAGAPLFDTLRHTSQPTAVEAAK